MGTGTHLLAGVRNDADELSLNWTGRLPEPVLDGNRATYAEVRPAVDLVVEATRTGFEQFLVVKSVAGAASVAELTLPVRSRGLNLASVDGGLEARDKAGETAAESPKPVMWDATVDARSGEHTRRREVDVRHTTRSATATDMVLTPDADFFTDPATAYPVTIDPAMNVSAYFDAFVQKTWSTDESGSTELKVGTFDGGNDVARSFLAWKTGAFTKKQIISATVSLWNWHSWSCAARSWEVWTTGAVNSSVRWTTQPTWLYKESTSIATAGYDSSCGAGWVSADARSFFQRPADASATDAYMGLKATSETDNLGWKRFNSGNASGWLPYATVNYNSLPSVAARATTPSTPCATGSSRPFVNTKTPTLSAQVVDPDGGLVKAWIDVWPTGGSGSVSWHETAMSPTGSLVSATVPAGRLAEGQNYSWRTAADDGLLFSADGRTPSSWAGWCEFTVDTIAPGVPVVSSTAYPEDGQWHGGANIAGDFVLAPASGNDGVSALVYQLDTDTAPTTLAATGSTTVSVKPTQDGSRTLTVWARDKAGNQSAPKVYPFKVGRAGLILPRPGANVVNRMKIAVDGESYLTRASVQYRRGPGAAEYDVPLGNLQTGTGGAVTGYPARLADLGGNAIWNATDTLGTTGGMVQVRASLWPDTDTETRLSMFRTNGTGAFIGSESRVGLQCNDSTGMFSHGDFDRDTRADVLCRRADGKIWLYRGDGRGGSSVEPRSDPRPSRPMPSSARATSTATTTPTSSTAVASTSTCTWSRATELEAG